MSEQSGESVVRCEVSVPTLREWVEGTHAPSPLSWEREVVPALRTLLDLLTAAMPSSMGGTPDLFFPAGYEHHRNPWMAWESDVEAHVGSSEQDQT